MYSNYNVSYHQHFYTLVTILPKYANIITVCKYSNKFNLFLAYLFFLFLEKNPFSDSWNLLILRWFYIATCSLHLNYQYHYNLKEYAAYLREQNKIPPVSSAALDTQGTDGARASEPMCTQVAGTREAFYFHKSTQHATLKMIDKIKGFESGVYVFTFIL